jgi:hypothetical protein
VPRRPPPDGGVDTTGQKAEQQVGSRAALARPAAIRDVRNSLHCCWPTVPAVAVLIASEPVTTLQLIEELVKAHGISPAQAATDVAQSLDRLTGFQLLEV